MFQLGFDAEAFELIFASDYKAKVLAAEEGRATRAAVERFLEKVLSSSTDLSFSKDQMLRENKEFVLMRKVHRLKTRNKQ